MSAKRIAGVVACPVLAGAITLIACSGDSGSTSGDPGSSGSTTTSGGTSGTTTSGGTSGGTSGTTTSGGTSGMTMGDPVAACISACETKYPQGTQIGMGIDTCWGQKCKTECNGIGAGQSKPPAMGSCKNDVRTPSAACSQCTVDKCCAAWDACFDNAQCSALNACSIACYK